MGGLADVALATNCIMTLLSERTERSLFSVESLLNDDQLEAIGARVMPKTLRNRENLVGATGIDPVTPTMSMSFAWSISLENRAKRPRDMVDQSPNRPRTLSDLLLNGC
jgi:hypothetical protein